MDDLNKFVEQAVRKLVLRTWQALTTATPVKTGFARAGWIPTSGAPEPGPEESGASRAKGITKKERESLARLQATALFSKSSQLVQTIAKGYTLKQGPVFIVNNVRYVVFLNEGSSAQAPAMFVESSISLAVAATLRDLAGGA